MESREGLYFVASIPGAPQQALVTEIKQYIASEYNLVHALKSPPHITLYPPFSLKTHLEAQLIWKLNDFAKGQSPFMLKINGLGRFSPRVVYLHVSSSREMITLQENLSEFLETSLSLSARHRNRAYKPHMTLATRIPTKELFFQVWNDMRDRAIEFDFLAEGLYLLRHNGMTWEVINQSSFEKPPCD